MLVAGAIPGERVRVRIERTSRQVAWADTVEVLEPSADRRATSGDPACGGALYSHVVYERQLQLKREVIGDAFRRVGKIDLDQSFTVAASPERGYRLRARLHVRGGRAGFFREGSHVLCEAGATGQLHIDAVPVVNLLLAAVGDRVADCDSIIVSENVTASERVVHLEPRGDARLDGLRVSLENLSGVTGVTTAVRGRTVALAGAQTVTDSAAQLFDGQSPIGALPAWTRHAASFFQANRFLLGALVRRVLSSAEGDACVDLYSGVGLFAVALAAQGSRVIAVEGDRVSAADLSSNAAPWRERLFVTKVSVEEFVRQPLEARPDVVVLDPPRTGVSAEALAALMGWQVPRLVYVSCDPPTLARDAARITAGGYGLASIDAFDLFPNTPHVETIAVFDRQA